MHLFYQVSTVPWVVSLQSPVLKGRMARLLVRSPQTTVSNVLLTTTVPDQVCFLPCSVAQWLTSHCRVRILASAPDRGSNSR